jgi:hypothetical protein
VLAASIIRALITLIMDAANISETSVKFYESTRHNNPKDSHLHSHHHENLRSHCQVKYDLQIFKPLYRYNYVVLEL